jgi:hypothetical protein
MADSIEFQGNGLKVIISDPENINQDECLQLAKTGKDNWNAWRLRFPSRKVNATTTENHADFHQIDFRQQQIDFAGFEFGESANFREVVFADHASFDRAKFGMWAVFDKAKFGKWACFQNTQFGIRASFNQAIFALEPRFDYAQFGYSASFDETQFGESSHFDEAQFAGGASFDRATFGKRACFIGTQFGDPVRFHYAQFGDDVHFDARKRDQMQSWRGHQMSSNAQWAKAYGLDPEQFPSASFSGVDFEGRVSFFGRKFDGPLQFTPQSYVSILPDKSVVGWQRATKFGAAPIFHECKFNQDTSFEKAIFPAATGSEEAARAYRTLKLAFTQQQAIREEQRFFKLEMLEEAKSAEKNNDRTRLLYRGYEYFSDFGFSVSRPLYVLIMSTVTALILYGLQADLSLCIPKKVTCEMTGSLFQFGLASALPGFEKLADPAAIKLFGKTDQGIANISVTTTITLLIHKAISVIFLFLIGLALRNLFKLK